MKSGLAAGVVVCLVIVGTLTTALPRVGLCDTTTQPAAPNQGGKEGIKTEVHAVGAGDPGPDGWVGARSEAGAFSVELPGRYNDATVTGKSVKGNVVVTHLVGVTVRGLGKFSVTRMLGGDRVADDAAAQDAAVGLAQGNRPPGRMTKVERPDGVAYDVTVVGAQTAARARFFARDGSMFVMIVEYPTLAAPPTDVDVNRFLGSFKVDPTRKPVGAAPGS